MKYLRIVTQKFVALDQLTQASVPFNTLVKTVFEQFPDPQTSKEISVFAIENEEQALQNVAGFLQHAPKTIQRHVGVLIDPNDLTGTGVTLKTSEGDTGISFIDARHANLIGTQAGFEALLARIVSRTWAGEQRLHVYPLHQILGQIAVFAKSDKGDIPDDAKANCQRVLEKHKDEHSIDEASRTVKLVKVMEQGKLPAVTVKSERAY